MKQAKKKKRSRPPKNCGKSAVSSSRKGYEDEEMALNTLMEAFASVSTEEAAYAYRETSGDLNKAAEILADLTGSGEDQDRSMTCFSAGGNSANGDLNERAETLEDLIESGEDQYGSLTCSSSGGSSGPGSTSGSSEGFMEASFEQNGMRWKGSRAEKKKFVAATGMVSTVIGKGYVAASPKKNPRREKGFNETLTKGDAEQFLCSMLGDDCELSMAVVRDILCQCGYDVEKALNVLLELSSKELSGNGPCHEYSTDSRDDVTFVLEPNDSLTYRTSDSTSSSSENEHKDNVWSIGYQCRNYSQVVAGSEAHSSTNPRYSESELPWKVLESLFTTPQSSEREADTMNWKNMAKKLESLGQKINFCPSGESEPQLHTLGDEYQIFRENARQHWDAMKSYYQKAATAYTNGERQYASYLSDQGREHNKMAREADEKASHKIFKARNKSIENVITIDLHGQHVKQAMRLLKVHLIFGAYVRSVQLFKVITGCGSHGTGKSKLKQSVIDLLDKEGIKWCEENRGTLLIRLDGQTEFSFLDSESDTE